VISFPNAKINLGLNITAKRSDGYHNLETVFYPVALNDVLEIIPGEELALRSHGLPIVGDPANNLCIQAYRIMKEKFPALSPVSVYLHKHIPPGSGLGGGSADAVFMLELLCRKFSLELSSKELSAVAAELGSDCPFFILNKPCFGKGRGELLTPVPLDLENYSIVLVHPGISISTAWAFARIKPAIPVKSVREIIGQPVETWKKELSNDFEAPVFAEYPELQELKERLYGSGALYASMTGSGSSLYGIFERDNMPKEGFLKHHHLPVAVDIISRAGVTFPASKTIS
jgi:4-diphosphocytidyl-2-C-methyl-D-erythritol kinase